MALDSTAQGYADQLFAKSVEELSRTYQERVRLVNEDFARRGMQRSGPCMGAITTAGVEYAESVARARVEAIILAYRKAGFRLDKQVVEEVLTEAGQSCEIRKNALIENLTL